ncbi:MAG TPA: hypothetical protein V6D22_25825 [Candidatus Obscuribacterales bacterium]
MADLDTRLHNIETVCAPAKDNACLHKELSGLSVTDAMTVIGGYVAFNTAAKHLPMLDMDDLLKAIPPGVDLSKPANLNAFNFHDPY